jgi:hypothetical protein
VAHWSRNTIKTTVLIALTTLIAICTISHPSFAVSTDENVVVQWNKLVLQIVRETRPSPPVVSRALAIVHTSMYDAWAAYDPVALGTQLGDDLRRPEIERTLDNKNQAISYAAYRALVDLFPSRKADFDAKMLALGYNPNNNSIPAGIGNSAAAAVIAFRHNDNSNQLGVLSASQLPYSDYTNYQPVNTINTLNDPNRWQPTPFFNPATGQFDIVRSFITPHWGYVTPFAMTSGSQFRPQQGPAQYPHGSYIAQANEILHLSAKLTDEHKMISEYWSDGPNTETPPGHWMLFAQFISQRDQHTLDEDVKLFFALANALMDAGIAAWDSKRAWDSVRPITAIRFLKAGKPIRAWGGPYMGTVKMSGEQWLPYQPNTFITPPFAEFVSGHSTFSSASAEILRLFTGSDNFGASVTLAAGSSQIEPGVTPASPVILTWPTFTSAADQAGMSRLYGGIHFMDANTQGQIMGQQIGALVWAKAQTYFNQ